MAKKALLIGINYVDSPYKLKGCHNDVGALRDLAIARFAHYAADSLKSVITEKFGFPAANVKILRDSGKPGEEMPTKANIMAAVSWLAEGAKPGDRLMMHFSGHGGQVKDEDGDEEDGYDGTSSTISFFSLSVTLEGLIPCDWTTNGYLIDDWCVHLASEGALITGVLF